MLGDISVANEFYIICGYTDMGRSIDGLCALLQNRLHMDPRQWALCLFCGKRCDRLKPLPASNSTGLCPDWKSNSPETTASPSNKEEAIVLFFILPLQLVIFCCTTLCLFNRILYFVLVHFHINDFISIKPQLI